MEGVETRDGVDSKTLLDDVTRILEDMTSDWDLEFSGGVGPETCLISDLAFESIDVVQLVVAIEERFSRRDLPFEKLLMADGRYVDDVRVSQIVQFLESNLGR